MKTIDLSKEDVFIPKQLDKDFNPSKLPDSELRQLWKLAYQKGHENLLNEIEEELSKRWVGN